MTSVPPQADFDTHPPMPLTDYEQTVKAVNVGYDFLFTLTTCFLRALGQPNLELLVVGAGGGMEIERFLPAHPGWRLTGVDPSQAMLALAQAKVERLGLGERVTLVQGTVEDLPVAARFGAATCLFVLHFLSDYDKLALLRGIAQRLRPQASLLVASGARIDVRGLGDDFLGAWQQHGELMDLPPERMAAIIKQLLGQQTEMTSEGDYVKLLQTAGFQRVAPVFSVMNGGMSAWIAR